MIDGLETDVDESDTARERRDEQVDTIREHAGTIARALARLQGGSYGQETFETGGGSWTLKHEDGALEYLRFSPKNGSDIYVVSTKQPPDPEDLVVAMADYGAFVDAFNEYLASIDSILDDVELEYPPAGSGDAVIARRDRLAKTIRDAADAMACELYRFEGEYGTFTRTVSGTRWELKWDGETTSYVRIGGEGGTYLVSQYGQPSATDLRRYGEEFAGFVDAFNAYVDELESDLDTVSIAPVEE